MAGLSAGLRIFPLPLLLILLPLNLRPTQKIHPKCLCTQKKYYTYLGSPVHHYFYLRLLTSRSRTPRKGQGHHHYFHFRLPPSRSMSQGQGQRSSSWAKSCHSTHMKQSLGSKLLYKPAFFVCILGWIVPIPLEERYLQYLSSSGILIPSSLMYFFWVRRQQYEYIRYPVIKSLYSFQFC